VTTTNLPIGSPVAGRTIPLAELPDPVFADGIVGPGVAVDPGDGRSAAVAPVDGSVATLHPHAFVIATADGRAVLVHLGLGTVRLRGAGFTLNAVRGEAVRAGQPIITWEPSALRADGYHVLVPVIALDAEHAELGYPAPGGLVVPGDTLFTWDD